MSNVKISESENINKIQFNDQPGLALTPPAAGFQFVFTRADGLYIVDSDGVETGPFIATGGGGAGSDTTAIHDDTAGEIAAITEKVSPVSADLLVIEDSAAGNVKKRVQIGNLPSGNVPAGGTTAQVLAKASNADFDTGWVDQSGGGGGADPAFTAPVDGDFAWINQGGASVTVASATIFLLAPTGTGNNLRIRKQAAPATPYTITVAWRPNFSPKQFGGGGILFRESSSGKIHSFKLYLDDTNGLNILSGKYTDPSTFDSVYVNGVFSMLGAFVWMRISDDGVNRKCEVSLDGRNFIVIHSVARTDFLTANEVGFATECNNGGAGDVGITVYSWVES